MSINQAHLIHNTENGRSSTRLHAPPGGHCQMGTSFGWDVEVRLDVALRVVVVHIPAHERNMASNYV
jgi:hypothetical protein